MTDPLITVGIPTYNRPQGLRQTLEQVVQQTYSNLEIVISDNCSPNPQVQEVIAEFSAKDRRVRSFRQDHNIGATANFRFVLKVANGEYFMWASDDDGHAPDFIERCLAEFRQHGNALGSVMSQGEIHNRAKCTRAPMHIPDFPRGQGLFRSLHHHLSNPIPTMIYGLHRRGAILWFAEQTMYDWFDCFFITKILTGGYEIAIAADYVGYIAGIDSDEYIPKPIRVRNKALFEYLPYVRATLREFNRSSSLKLSEKMLLGSMVAEFAMRNFTHWERKARPVQARASKVFVLPPLRIARQLLSLGC